MNPKQILEAIGILAKAPAAEVAKILQDSALDKAAQDLTHSEMVESRWEEGHMHEHISKEAIRTGPEQRSSGDGAEKMIRDYSNPADQKTGIMQQAESLARLIAPMAAASKAQTQAIGALLENVKSLNVTLAALVTAKSEPVKTAKAKEDEDEEDEEESEVVEINGEKAKSYIARAKVLIAKAKKAEGDAQMVEDDEEEEKACKKKARAFRKQAGILLGKARTAAFIAGDKETRKAIRLIATKAEVNVVEEEEEDEEDEDEKSKAAVAEKAKGSEAAGNQADHANKEGNQDSTAVKALTEMSGKVEEALKGMGMLSMDLRGMMDVVSGRSKGTGAVPEFTKSTIDPTLALVNKIEELEDAGQLTDTDAFAARDIVSKMTAARAGQLDASIVHDRIAKSTLPVQMLFKAATTAAA